MSISSSCAKRAHSQQRQRLIELMQRVNFGRLEGLVVRNGDPLFDPPPRVIREIKFGGENGPRPELESEDFVLKAQVVDLLAQLDRLHNGTIDAIEVKHGLPFRAIIAEVPA